MVLMDVVGEGGHDEITSVRYSYPQMFALSGNGRRVENYGGFAFFKMFAL